jgi:hypothetical protein
MVPLNGFVLPFQVQFASGAEWSLLYEEALLQERFVGIDVLGIGILNSEMLSPQEYIHGWSDHHRCCPDMIPRILHQPVQCDHILADEPARGAVQLWSPLGPVPLF